MLRFFKTIFGMHQEIAVITGGNTGMGYQTARSLALQGYKVIATGRDEQKLKDAALAINAMNHRCLSGTGE